MYDNSVETFNIICFDTIVSWAIIEVYCGIFQLISYTMILLLIRSFAASAAPTAAREPNA